MGEGGNWRHGYGAERMHQLVIGKRSARLAKVVEQSWL